MRIIAKTYVTIVLSICVLWALLTVAALLLRHFPFAPLAGIGEVASAVPVMPMLVAAFIATIFELVWE